MECSQTGRPRNERVYLLKLLARYESNLSHSRRTGSYGMVQRIRAAQILHDDFRYVAATKMEVIVAHGRANPVQQILALRHCEASLSSVSLWGIDIPVSGYHTVHMGCLHYIALWLSRN